MADNMPNTLADASVYAIDLAAIQQAASRIAQHVIRTPVVSCSLIDQRADSQLFFKCENLQHVGAFKARGACNAVFELTDAEAAAGVVTHSSGNHAAALARAARLRGIEAHIVMPRNSSTVKIDAVRGLGVEPRFCEPDATSRQAMADEVIAETGATFIHPYNNSMVMAGQGTAALELLEQVSNLDAMIAPVGGGGLLSGTLIAAKSLKPEIRIYGAEPAWADDAKRSLQSGQIQQPTRYDTIADGLRTPLGTLTFPIVRDLVEDILLADEQSIKHATKISLCDGKLVVEPSGAVPLAAILGHPELFEGLRVGVIVSGGNAEPATFASILQDDA